MTDEDIDSMLFGARKERREDTKLLTGEADYVDNLSEPGMVYLSFSRSQYGHARIENVDTDGAEEVDGVLGVYTWDDVRGTVGTGTLADSNLELDVPSHPILARDQVTYQGQPIAAVVAEDRYTAANATDEVDVAYERLDAVPDPAEATAEEAPAIFEAAPDNVAMEEELGDEVATDAAFAEADHTVSIDLVNNRLMANAMEPRVALAEYDRADHELTVTVASQKPHHHRTHLAETLGLPEQKVRVIAPDVGGGFGHKGHYHPGEAVASWCSMELDRPVKWTATRSENYLEGAHARDHATHGELAFDDDGTIRGLRVEANGAIGGYPLGYGPHLVTRHGRLLSSEYEISEIYCRARAVLTNTAPVHSYRGAGRPEAVYVTERLVDLAARELDVDPVELRRQNLISSDAFPYETPVGAEYDSGDYEPAMDTALDAIDYEHNRERQADLRDEGRYLGIGVANYVESTGQGYENSIVRVHPSGGVVVYAGTHSHGQGHGTTYAQIVADQLGVDYDDIEVIEGDTERVGRGSGTSGSRSMVTGGSAVAQSAEKVAEKARRIAAHELEVAEEDVELDDGEFHVAGAPDRSISFSEVAESAHGRMLPDGIEPGLEATTYFAPDGVAYTFGTHAAVVEVDPASGEIDVLDYVAVDDCGERINPMIVEGQIQGAVTQGIGQALYEHAVYDDNGNLVTGSMQDYAVPKSIQVPEIELDATVTPSPHNPIGVKGIGEGGTMAAPPTIVNAVCDALEPFGVDHLDMPLTEETVWQAVADGER